jgi:hypothetical protein
MPVGNGNDEDGDGRQGSGASQRLQAHEVSIEEYNDLAKRLDTMEASVGFVLNKVKTLKKILFFNRKFHLD